MNVFKLRQVGPRTHKVLWICLLGLTIGIIIWTVTPSIYDPLPVQSIYAIKHLPWFIALFSVWVLNLAFLLFFVRGNVWERLALCLVFFLVFIQFWGFKAAPWGNSLDSAWLMGHVNYLEHTTRIPTTEYLALRYFDYPGLTLVGLAVKQLSGTDLFLAIRIYLTLSGLCFVVILYTLFIKLLKTSYLAALGGILAVLCSTLGATSNQFHPINLATIYMAVFFLLLTMRGIKGLSEQQIFIIVLLLTIASTMEYMFTPVLFSMILIANYIFHRLAKTPGNIPLTTVILPIVLFLSWQIFFVVYMFRSSIVGVSTALDTILSGGWMTSTGVILKENFGANYPWWGNITKAFWWLSVFGFGSLLMLWRLLHSRRADSNHRTEIASFVGILATILIGSVAVGSISVIHGGIIRYLWVSPFVLAPALIGFLTKLRTKYVVTVFSIVGILLVLPTFLTNADNISSDITDRSEIATFEFINSSYREGEQLSIYGFSFIPAVSFIYEPDAKLHSGFYIYAGVKKANIWNGLERQAKLFLGSNYEAPIAIFSVEGKVEWQRYLQIPLNNPNWQELETTLSAGNRIYDDGDIELYSPY